MSHDEHTKGGRKLPRVSTIVILALLILCVNLLFVSFGDYPEDNEIRVAVLMPFSGSMSDFGIEYGRGVEIAIQELNGHVLPGGRTYVADFYDTEGEAVSLLNTFMQIYNDGYPVVIGPATSTEALNLAKYAEMLGLVMISPGATTDELSQYKDYMFRTVSSDRYLASGLGKLVGTNDEFETIMVLHTDNSYGVGLAEIFVEELSSYHKDVATMVEIPTDPRYVFDAGGAVALMVETQPDAVFAVMEDSVQFIDLLKRADSADVHPQWFVTDTASTSNVAESGIADGVIAGIPSKKATSDSYAEKYAEKFGYSMKISDSVYGYDTMMLLAEVVSNRGYTSEDIRDGLREIRYVGLSGAVVFDENADRYPVYDILQVRDGKWVTLPWNEVMQFEAGGH